MILVDVVAAATAGNTLLLLLPPVAPWLRDETWRILESGATYLALRRAQPLRYSTAPASIETGVEITSRFRISPYGST